MVVCSRAKILWVPESPFFDPSRDLKMQFGASGSGFGVQSSMVITSFFVELKCVLKAQHSLPEPQDKPNRLISTAGGPIPKSV